MNFVFLSLQRINTDRESTSTSLAKELAKNHRVLYVNPAIDRKTLLSAHHDQYIAAHIRDVKEGRPSLIQQQEQLWVLNPPSVLESINWIPFTDIFSVFNKLNNKRLAGDIQKALVALNFDSFILVNDKDMFRSFYLKELLKPRRYIYLDRDYTLAFDYWKKHGTRLEPQLMQKSDAVVCNSIDFTKRAARYNPQSYYIGNGCDLSLFDVNVNWPKPKNIEHTTQPIIGYVGALHSMRLDIPLLEQLVAARPEWTFVFAGEEDEQFKKSRLHELSNACFVGKIHKKNIPALVQYFDVCINPQLINEITIGNFPLKIVEYLAMGKPVVATATNTMKEVFNDYTFLATTRDEYLIALDEALQTDSRELHAARINFVKQYTWENVVSIFMSVVKKIDS
jgi:teichuronic acid biosynthesis glycosyltransferase TuaH